MNMDEFTRLLTKAIEGLALRNPVRSSIGVVIGITLSGFSPVFSPFIQDLLKLDFSNVHPLAWVALGILGTSLRGTPIKPKLPEDVEVLFDIIDQADKAGLSKAEIKTKYQMILNKYIANIALNREMQNELAEVKKKLSGG
jgi:hypothetical protein